MEKKVGIIDYGMGNLFSISKALECVGGETKIISSNQDFDLFNFIVLPGVGGFSEGMKNLMKFVEPIKQQIEKGKPFLGICLGLQLLFSESEEIEFSLGLNILAGKVRKIKNAPKLPQMGWNNLNILRPDSFLEGIGPQDYFYFVHSYCVSPQERNLILAETFYGEEIPAAIRKDNIFGVQFHPEKSGEIGLKLLDNFLNRC